MGIHYKFLNYAFEKSDFTSHWNFLLNIWTFPSILNTYYFFFLIGSFSSKVKFIPFIFSELFNPKSNKWNIFS